MAGWPSFSNLRIDSHLYWSEQHPLEHAAPILERNRFDGAMVEVESSPVIPEIHHAFVKGIIVRADAGNPQLGSLLDGWQQNGRFRGVGCRIGGQVPEGLEELERRAVPADLDMEPGQLPLVSQIADRFPRLRIAIVRLGNPRFDGRLDDDWARSVERVAQSPQTYMKVSGLLNGSPSQWSATSFRPYVQHALAVFGPGRMMFGSGWPHCLPAASWKETLAAFTQSIGPLPMESREELLGGAAQRFYGIAP